METVLGVLAVVPGDEVLVLIVSYCPSEGSQGHLPLGQWHSKCMNVVLSYIFNRNTGLRPSH